MVISLLLDQTLVVVTGQGQGLGIVIVIVIADAVGVLLEGTTVTVLGTTVTDGRGQEMLTTAAEMIETRTAEETDATVVVVVTDTATATETTMTGTAETEVVEVVAMTIGGGRIEVGHNTRTALGDYDIHWILSLSSNPSHPISVCHTYLPP